MNTGLFYIFLCLAVVKISSLSAIGQTNEGIVTRAVVLEGDTIPFIELRPFTLLAPRIFTSHREEIRFTRLVYNIKRVYPYAKLAGQKFVEYHRLLSSIPESQRKRVSRELENQIREEFEGDLRRLTITQGHILIKLIDRETQHTSFDVVKEFRGGFNAVFWQSVGRLFGYNLKTRYDPNGADRHIEDIVVLIEKGLL